jgi:hypothetical protein
MGRRNLKKGDSVLAAAAATYWSDELLMLTVLEACITEQVLPAKNSPCHKRLRKIIREAKRNKTHRSH